MTSLNQHNSGYFYFWEEFQKSRESDEEIHYNHDCGYIPLNGRKITGTNMNDVTFLIRKCHCGYYESKENLADITEFSLD